MAQKQTPWQQKMARLRKAPPAELIVEVPLDPEPRAALGRAAENLTATEQQARTRWFGIRGDLGALTAEDRQAMEQYVDEAPEVIAMRAVREHAQAAVDDSTMFLMFRSLPPDAYEAAQAPYQKDGRLDMEAFRPVLVSLCHVHVEPGPKDSDGERTWIESEGMTEDEAADFLATPGMNAADVQAIVNAAYQVNGTTRVGYADLGKGSRQTRA